jgi:hypothetical protein
MDTVRKIEPLKRFDLLRSPLLLLAVGVLLLNDFVLKAAFHNGLTGKLSDVAGLAAVTIFCCALWPRDVWRIGTGIAIFFTFWKSLYSAGLIEAANAVLPFAIGRTVDYTDLIALPVVWLVCANAHRLPLVDVGKLGVWLTAGVCLFAFTATSSVDEHAVTRTSELTRPATDAGLQALFDRVAEQQGLECHTCDLPSRGRSYWSKASPLVMLDLSFDADPPQRLYFNVFALTFNEKLPTADRQRVDRVAAAAEAALKAEFPGLDVQPWTAPRSRRLWIDLRLGPAGRTGAGDSLSDDGDYGRATVIMDEVAHRYGLRGSRGGYFLDAVLPRLKIVAFDIPADGSRVIWIDAWPEQSARQQALTDELLRRLRQAFGEERVVRRQDS